MSDAASGRGGVSLPRGREAPHAAGAAPDRTSGTQRTHDGRGASKWIGFCFIAPLLAFLTLVYVVPFLGVAEWSVTLPKPGLGQYERLAADPLVLSVFVRTFRICAIVTARPSRRPTPSPMSGCAERGCSGG